jgi:tRNA (guanine10-N2)-dimethyltransferase
VRYLSGSVFVLSGEELTLPFAEIRALVQTYDGKRCESLGRRIAVSDVDSPTKVSKITERAAYTRFGGILVSEDQTPEKLTKGLDVTSIEKGKTFAVDSETLPREIYGEIGGQIKQKTGARVSLRNPDYLFQAEKTDNGNFVMGVSAGYKKFNWKQRRPRARKFFLPSAIYPKLARFLVNLSRVKENEYFLDPFCGTGSLLIEGSLMGIRSIGIDLTRWIARGALLNLKGFGLEFESIIRADSTSRNFPLCKVDAVSTDVPYGRASSTKGKDTRQIAKEFTQSAADILNPDKYCVLMHPSHVELQLGNSFELLERHLLYVHRNLTRAISVLKRRRS